MKSRFLRTGAWCRAGRADCQASHARRLTAVYRAKRRMTRRVWIGACLLTLLSPQLPIALILGLLSTFVSFALLDETADP